MRLATHWPENLHEILLETWKSLPFLPSTSLIQTFSTTPQRFSPPAPASFRLLGRGVEKVSSFTPLKHLGLRTEASEHPSGSSLILLKSGKLVKAVGESCLSLHFEDAARSRGIGAESQLDLEI